MPFQPGVSGNPKGRPKGSKNALPRFNQLILSKFSEDDVYEVLKSVHEQAKEGDVTACKTFLDYFLIKADKRIELEQEAEQPNLSHLTTEQLVAIVNIAEGREISQPV